MTLSVGFVGAGFVAKFHARAIQQVRDVEINGIVALAGAEKLSAFVRTNDLGRGEVFESIDKMADYVDVIAIFSPNYTRLDVMRQIVEAVENGAGLSGVICEKPLARNLTEANEMVELANSAKLDTAYFENQMFMSCVVAARQQLGGVMQAMGQVHLTRSAEEHGGPHEPWFWDPTRQGGGVWCDMGCHSAAVGQYMLTPLGKPPNHLLPQSVNATMALLKWGKEPWVSRLRERGVDYDKTPAEDYALVTITFRDPETGVFGIAQATDSWMYDAPGLRLAMEAYGPGYNHVVDTGRSPVGLFISDAAAAAVADSELALEKAQASRGALVLQPNEPELYGYVGEWRDAVDAFTGGAERRPLLDFEFGRDVTRLVMAGYMSHELGKTLDLTDPAVLAALETYIPAIQKGEGAGLLLK